MKTEILPSLLAADIGRLADEIARAEQARADRLHIDIMDPSFVPNISFSPDVVALCRRVAPGLHRNVHLMMSRPDLYLEVFAKAGADSIQIHYEADCDPHRELRRIRELGCRSAIVINPETPAEKALAYLDEADEVLVMTVRPGYGGQKLIPECLGKVSFLRRLRPEMGIMVDGGINGETFAEALAAGANLIVSGSWLYRADDMGEAIARMKAGRA